MSASRSRHRAAGFTLVEVLATMVLLTVLLPVVMHGVSLSMQAADNARHSSEAAELAESKMAELTMDPAVLTGGSQSGDFSSQGFPQYRWQANTISRDDLGTGLLEVQLDVMWDVRGVQHDMNVTSWAYQPGTPTQ